MGPRKRKRSSSSEYTVAEIHASTHAKRSSHTPRPLQRDNAPNQINSSDSGIGNSTEEPSSPSSFQNPNAFVQSVEHVQESESLQPSSSSTGQSRSSKESENLENVAKFQEAYRNYHSRDEYEMVKTLLYHYKSSGIENFEQAEELENFVAQEEARRGITKPDYEGRYIDHSDYITAKKLLLGFERYGCANWHDAQKLRDFIELAERLHPTFAQTSIGLATRDKGELSSIGPHQPLKPSTPNQDALINLLQMIPELIDSNENVQGPQNLHSSPTSTVSSEQILQPFEPLTSSQTPIRAPVVQKAERFKSKTKSPTETTTQPRNLKNELGDRSLDDYNFQPLSSPSSSSSSCASEFKDEPHSFATAVELHEDTVALINELRNNGQHDAADDLENMASENFSLNLPERAEDDVQEAIVEEDPTIEEIPRPSSSKAKFKFKKGDTLKNSTIDEATKLKNANARLVELLQEVEGQGYEHVYLVLDNGKIIYVGKSYNVAFRLYQHINSSTTGARKYALGIYKETHPNWEFTSVKLFPDGTTQTVSSTLVEALIINCASDLGLQLCSDAEDYEDEVNENIVNKKKECLPLQLKNMISEPEQRAWIVNGLQHWIQNALKSGTRYNKDDAVKAMRSVSSLLQTHNGETRRKWANKRFHRNRSNDDQDCAITTLVSKVNKTPSKVKSFLLSLNEDEFTQKVRGSLSAHKFAANWGFIRNSSKCANCGNDMIFSKSSTACGWHWRCHHVVCRRSKKRASVLCCERSTLKINYAGGLFKILQMLYKLAHGSTKEEIFSEFAYIRKGWQPRVFEALKRCL